MHGQALALLNTMRRPLVLILSKRRMRYQMVVVYYFRLIFFLISFASLNRLLAILSLIAAICIISLW